MRRLTKADWKVINAALALYEATPEMVELGVEEGLSEDEMVEAEERWGEAVQQAREKVWERLR